MMGGDFSLPVLVYRFSPLSTIPLPQSDNGFPPPLPSPSVCPAPSPRGGGVGWGGWMGTAIFPAGAAFAVGQWVLSCPLSL